MHLSCTISEI